MICAIVWAFPAWPRVPVTARLYRCHAAVGRTSPPFVQATAAQHAGQSIEVWFDDEARIGPQGTPTRCWGLPGLRPTVVQQTAYEWVYLFGAVNPLTGQSCALLVPTVNTQCRNHHLRFLSEQVGADVHVVLVLDGAGRHGAKALQVPSNMTLLPLPPCSPERNPVERL